MVLGPLQLRTATADGSADVEAKQNEILKNEDFMEEIYGSILSYVTNSARDLNNKQDAWKGTAKKFGLDVEEVMKNVHQHSNEL